MPANRHICRSYEELVEFLPQWERLVERSDPNVFYEPALLLPALKHLSNDLSPFVVLIFGDEDKRRLIGLFPTVVANSFRRMRLRHFANWRYEHAFYCAPLIDNGKEDVCFEALASSLQEEHPGTSSFSFDLVDHDSPLFGTLATQNAFTSHVESYERAQLDIGAFDPAQMLTAKHRKDLRRRERRLGDLGELTIHFDEATNNLDQWMNDFLALEAASWKGRNGTAMNSTPAGREFFTEALTMKAETNGLLVTSMRLDGRLIASTCDLVSGDRAFAFKIAYDESLGRYSSGILVAMKHAERLKRDGRFAWADSCAQKDSEMANRLYPERRKISTIVLSQEATAASLVTSHVLPTFRAATSRLSKAAGSLRSTPAKK